MDQFIAALIGALVGGLVTALGNFKLDEHQRNKRRENLRSALAVEVASLVNICRKQKYAYYLGFYAAFMRAAPGENYSTYHIPASHHYFSIFESNSNTIGELEVGEAADIITFYQQARSILDSLSAASAPNPELVNKDVAANNYDLLAGDIVRLCTFGDALVSRLSSARVAEKIAENSTLLSEIVSSERGTAAV